MQTLSNYQGRLIKLQQLAFSQIDVVHLPYLVSQGQRLCDDCASSSLPDLPCEACLQKDGAFSNIEVDEPLPCLEGIDNNPLELSPEHDSLHPVGWNGCLVDEATKA